MPHRPVIESLNGYADDLRVDDETAKRLLPPQFGRLARESLVRSAAGFVIALLAGANVYDAATSLAWGAVGVGVLGAVVVLTISLILGARAKRRGHDVEARTQPTRIDGFFEGIFGSWRGEVFFLLVLVLAALDDPLFAALIAGYPVGASLVMLPLASVVASIIGHWTNRPDDSGGS